MNTHYCISLICNLTHNIQNVSQIFRDTLYFTISKQKVKYTVGKSHEESESAELNSHSPWSNPLTTDEIVEDAAPLKSKTTHHEAWNN